MFAVRLFGLLSLLLIAALAGANVSAQAADNSSVHGAGEDRGRIAAPLKVGFLCVGPINDWGFNSAHNQGRIFMEKNFPGQVQSTLAEKIPESAEAERVLEKMIAQGNRLIFTTSYGYLEPVLRVASRHKDVAFMQINRVSNQNNIGAYMSNQYQPMYLAGMVAGRMTKSNKLGFVAAHPVPPLIQAINSFTMGARSVNSKVETQVIFINSWSDGPLEAEAVKSLVEAGCDVVGHAQDNQNSLLRACESLGVYSVGFYTDAHALAPKGWLTGACLDWGPFYLKIAKQVKNHSWQPLTFTNGMVDGEGYIKLASFGRVVPPAVKIETLAKQKLLETGKFVIFSGPLKDRDGKLRIAAGKKLEISELAQMNWFVQGVHGSLPKK
jgi:basic membrane protein A